MALQGLVPIAQSEGLKLTPGQFLLGNEMFQEMGARQLWRVAEGAWPALHCWADSSAGRSTAREGEGSRAAAPSCCLAVLVTDPLDASIVVPGS